MKRKEKLRKTAITSLLRLTVNTISGLILPRLFIENYGSEVNGLVNSIAQFLSYISLLEFGLCSVISSSLYGPLAKNNIDEISKIVVSSEKFFRKIAYILISYCFLLMLIYPFFIGKQFGYIFVASLIFALSINSFAQYYFGITWTILLNADQKAYIHYFVEIITLIANMICCIYMIKMGISVQVVKFATAFIFLLQPIANTIYVKRNYSINRKVEITKEPIQQKKNGIAQHIAFTVFSSTDIIVLTLFSSLSAVSIYSVYHYVVTALTNIFQSITIGITALIGNMLSNNEFDNLKRFFSKYVCLLHMSVVVIISTAAKMIIPFVKLYTRNVTDTNYDVPVFAMVLLIAYAFYIIRIPYNQLVMAAGHYKQTQNGAIIEAVINIIVSVVMVSVYGLSGVAIGTLCAIIYRTGYLVYYLSKHIINIKFFEFIRQSIVDVITVIIIIIEASLFSAEASTYFVWIIKSIFSLVIFLFTSILVNCILGYWNAKYLVEKIIKK